MKKNIIAGIITIILVYFAYLGVKYPEQALQVLVSFTILAVIFSVFLLIRTML